MKTTGFRRFLLGLMGALVLVSGPAVAEETTCGVKYVSAEHVYLDAGAAAGLVAGLQARVVRGSDTIAVLEVVFTAGFSASCKVVSSTGKILPGDTVVYDSVQAAEAPEVAPAVPAAPRTRMVLDQPPSLVQRPGPRVAGSLAIQWDHADETADRGLSNDFLRLPFRGRVTNLGAGTEIRARGSFRHLSRAGYGPATPASEWRNRIQEVAWVRDGRRQDFHFTLGRIGTRYTASAGSFDGFSFDHRLGKSMRAGAFGGFSPDWGTLSFSTDNKLVGVSFNFNRRTSGGRYLDLILAGVGRYSQGQVSREYLTMTTSWRDGSKVSLLQAAEIDLNRDWRKTSGNSTMELTSLALTGRYQVNPRVALNLGYDDRDPIRTWESRSLPDSLFTDAGRTGWRAGMSWRGKSGKNVSLWGSLRERAGSGDQVTSWNGRVFLPKLTRAAVDLRLSVRGFNGPYLSGLSPTLGVARSTAQGVRLGLEGGYYVYSASNDLPDRDNTWLMLSGSGDLSAHWSVHAEYRRDWGDDIAGNRLFLEMRRRF